MIVYRDKRGNPLTLMEWAKLFEDRDYQVISQTRHKEKGKEFFFSTIWMGMSAQPGMLFETMACFYKPKWNEVVASEHEWDWQERYRTEDEALEARDPWRVVTESRPDILRLLIDAVFGPSG